jgi:hypothetical protein
MVRGARGHLEVLLAVLNRNGTQRRKAYHPDVHASQARRATLRAAGPILSVPTISGHDRQAPAGSGHGNSGRRGGRTPCSIVHVRGVSSSGISPSVHHCRIRARWSR